MKLVSYSMYEEPTLLLTVNQAGERKHLFTNETLLCFGIRPSD